MLKLQTDAGPCTLTATAEWLGSDLLVALTGGAAHIGSISSTAPGEPLHTLEYPHHKDATLGNRFAQALQKELGCKVTVVCGVHVDELDRQGIEEILQAGEGLLAQLLDLLRNKSKG